MSVIERQFDWLGGHERARMLRMLARVAEDIATLELADNNWATLSATQRTDASRLAVRTSARIGRLLLARFEAE